MDPTSLRATDATLTSIDAGKITHKGCISEGAVSNERADLVDNLYDDNPAADVIVV